MVELFAHNLTAYKSAALMLAETGKAAIIHPTGTGKFFIAFFRTLNKECMYHKFEDRYMRCR